MPRLGILNMLIGFGLLFFAACGGAFVAISTTQSYLEGAQVSRWSEILQTSSHGHTSLFGLIHICFGLTLPYSVWSARAKRLHTIALACGAFAMGPAMLVRASFGPTSSFEWNGLVIGALLSLSLAALLAHATGLALKLMRRA